MQRPFSQVPHTRYPARWGSNREKKLGPFADSRKPYTFSQLFNFLQLKVPRAQFVLTVREVNSQHARHTSPSL